MGAFTLPYYPWSFLVFLLFVIVCGMLVESRFSKRGTVLAAAGFLAGIAAVQIGLIASGQDAMLVLTLLPLTAYLPAIVGVHVLSRAGLFQTVAVWTIGAMAAFVLTFLQKLLITGLGAVPPFSRDLVQTGCLLLAAVALALVAYRWLRTPFRTYVLRGATNWLPLCLAVASVFLLLSYFASSTANPLVTALLFLVALSVFLIVARMLATAAHAQRARDAERAAAVQLEMQRGEYAKLLEKLEAGRRYRHDLRHHLMVLEGLAKKGDNPEIERYLGGLDARLGETQPEVYCENPSANAVLAFCAAQAREAGCTVKVCADIPAHIPFDELDVCVLLANALENATRACERIPAESERIITASALFDEGGSLRVDIENPCVEQLDFDADGLPVVEKREGHGIGLRSIDAVTRKYSGLLRCMCEDGTFRLRAVLFDAPEVAAAKRAATPARRPAQTTLTLGCVLLLMACCMPTVARASGDAFGWDSPFGLADVRVDDFNWGDTAFRALVPRIELREAAGGSQGQAAGQGEAPAEAEAAGPSADAAANAGPSVRLTVEPPATGSLSWESGGEHGGADAGAAGAPVVVLPFEPSEGGASGASDDGASDDGASGAGTSNNPDPAPDLSQGVDDINRQMEAYVAQMREKFLWYAARKYNGYVGMDVTYKVTRNDAALLAIRFDATLNAGGSGQYSRTFTLDRRTGRVLELADLFVPGADFVGVVSAEVLRQMTQQVNAGTADYFIPGGIWRPDECFQRIAPDQNFSIDAANRLVIVFDEYEVAPGRAGMPEFAIPTGKLAGILRAPSILA